MNDEDYNNPVLVGKFTTRGAGFQEIEHLLSMSDGLSARSYLQHATGP
jgi:hypothetical protein